MISCKSAYEKIFVVFNINYKSILKAVSTQLYFSSVIIIIRLHHCA